LHFRLIFVIGSHRLRALRQERLTLIQADRELRCRLCIRIGIAVGAAVLFTHFVNIPSQLCAHVQQ